MINTRKMQDGPDKELARAFLAGQNRRARFIGPASQFEMAIRYLTDIIDDVSVKNVGPEWFYFHFERNDARVTNRAAFSYGAVILPALFIEFDDLEKNLTYTGYIEGLENIAKFISWLEVCNE